MVARASSVMIVNISETVRQLYWSVLYCHDRDLAHFTFKRQVTPDTTH